MFLSKNYVLMNEIIEKCDIVPSRLKDYIESCYAEDDNYSVIRRGGCVFVNIAARKFPEHFREAMRGVDFTDYSDKLPATWCEWEYGVSYQQLRDGLGAYHTTIHQKNFYVFPEKFVKKMSGMVGYVLSSKEARECERSGDILGKIKICDHKYFTWYPLHVEC